MHALSPGIDILPHADGRRLRFSLGKEPSTCLECCSWWLGVCVELAIGCLGECLLGADHCSGLPWIEFFFFFFFADDLGVLYILWLLISSQVYENMFSYSVGYFFTLIIPSEYKKIFKKFMKSNLSVFSCVAYAFDIIFKIFFLKFSVLKHLP